MKNMYRSLLIVLMLLTSFVVNAQEQPGLRDRANQLYKDYEYANAASIYLRLADVKKPKLTDLERLADCFRKMNDYEAAENWYARVIQYPESKADNLLAYGAILKANARYDKAKQMLQQYAAKTGDKKRVLNEIIGCDSALIWLAKPTAHKLKNEEQVNTTLSEFGVFPMGDKVYYTGEPNAAILKNTYGRTGNPYLRIYTAERRERLALGAGTLDNSVYNDDRYHSGPVIGNKRWNQLFVTRTYVGKDGEVSKEDRQKYRTNNLELVIYTLNNGIWESRAFAYNDVQRYSVGHAALSPDEKILYFVSDMPGGSGGTDIWFSELQSDGSWGAPQNAGTSVNSDGNEMFPNVAVDGTMYYSSNGLPGMGELDIFTVKGTKNHWSKPVNLRYPVNSAGDDFAFAGNSEDEISGYLSSNRQGGKGGDDIYSFTNLKPKLIFALKGTTLNKKTGEVLPATAVSLFGNGRRIVARQDSKEDGTFFFDLEANTNYKVLGQKLKFFSDSATVSTKGLVKSDTLVATLRLQPLLEVGQVFVLENIHYDFDKDKIRPDATEILDELVRIMRDNPTLEIELGSHTDSRGLDSYNLDLSQRRAKSAVNYLVSRGISRNRMTARGYGETMLLNKCSDGVKCSSAEHQQNRRTEFKVVKN
ncbi:OmpA family protein [Pedobacter frigoris]|uniref:OmpA family protein n=2 Tax=Pedobacter frigoris TaxID=2571272 RepID=A0A4U1CCK1_9SPHI|nr:OmpA family protein [Pedobacter frigoris]